MKSQKNQTLEELENEFWKEEKNYVSNLIRRCHEYRKIPIGELDAYQLCTMITQNIGLDFLLDLVITKLDKKLFFEEEMYEGSLFDAVIKSKVEDWPRPIEFQIKLKNVLEKHREVFIREYSLEEYDLQIRKIEDLAI